MPHKYDYCEICIYRRDCVSTRLQNRLVFVDAIEMSLVKPAPMSNPLFFSISFFSPSFFLSFSLSLSRFFSPAPRFFSPCASCSPLIEFPKKCVRIPLLFPSYVNRVWFWRGREREGEKVVPKA